jgi:hypothetical protein
MGNGNGSKSFILIRCTIMLSLQNILYFIFYNVFFLKFLIEIKDKGFDPHHCCSIKKESKNKTKRSANLGCTHFFTI